MEADEAVESLKSWREGLTVRRMHPPESVGMSPLPESIGMSPFLIDCLQGLVILPLISYGLGLLSWLFTIP